MHDDEQLMQRLNVYTTVVPYEQNMYFVLQSARRALLQGETSSVDQRYMRTW